MQAGGKIDPGAATIRSFRCARLAEELQYTPDKEEAQFLGTFSCAAANEPEHLLEPHLFQIRARTASSLLISTEAAGQLRLAPFTRDHMLLLAGMTFG